MRMVEFETVRHDVQRIIGRRSVEFPDGLPVEVKRIVDAVVYEHEVGMGDGLMPCKPATARVFVEVESYALPAALGGVQIPEGERGVTVYERRE